MKDFETIENDRLGRGAGDLMGRLFLLAILAMMVYFSLKSLFKPINKPAKGPVFKKKSSEPATEMIQDPVCGVYVDPSIALSLEAKGVIHYFCSEDCMKNFQKKLNRENNHEQTAGR